MAPVQMTTLMFCVSKIRDHRCTLGLHSKYVLFVLNMHSTRAKSRGSVMLSLICIRMSYVNIELVDVSSIQCTLSDREYSGPNTGSGPHLPYCSLDPLSQVHRHMLIYSRILDACMIFLRILEHMEGKMYYTDRFLMDAHRAPRI